MSPKGWLAWRLVVLLLAGCVSGGCDRRSASSPDVDMAWTLTPERATVGPATLSVTLRRPSGARVHGASVHLEGHMSHAGMAPILAEGVERTAGDYDVPFAFTMRGDWVLLVSAVLPDGGRVERRVDIANVQPSD
jgi:hypothetical protein